MRAVSVESSLIEGRDDCISFNLEGGMRGRIWIDADTYDVLRLDQGLGGLVEIPLPKAASRRSGSPSSWTMERWQVQSLHDPPLAPLLQFFEEDVPSKASVALAFADNGFGYPYFGPHLDRHVFVHKNPPYLAANCFHLLVTLDGYSKGSTKTSPFKRNLE
jgi:hypothetical protein